MKSTIHHLAWAWLCLVMGCAYQEESEELFGRNVRSVNQCLEPTLEDPADQAGQELLNNKTSTFFSYESCGSACTRCVLENRPDILPFYAANGWDTDCHNRDNIISNWCTIDPLGCDEIRTGVCSASCDSSTVGGCDNGVPIYGTACKNQGDLVEYVCLPGSVPGNSLWQERSCNGGKCQGTSCTSTPEEGCDNGVPIYGTACKNQGDPVEYVCLPGSVPGNSLWQERSCNGGSCVGASCTSSGEGCDNGVPICGTACKFDGDDKMYICQPGSQPGKSIWAEYPCPGSSVCKAGKCGPIPIVLKKLDVGANYTDIGVGPDGSVIYAVKPNGTVDFNMQALQAVIEVDLRRLHQAGVRDLRIWAPMKGLVLTNDDHLKFMAERIRIVADLAKVISPNMQITVTLFDAQRKAGDPDTHMRTDIDNLLRRLFSKVVAPNRYRNNIAWSIGNEIAGPNTPKDFAEWYRAKVKELRKTIGPYRHVVAELVPGSLNHHFEDQNTQEAVEIILANSNKVSVHYYTADDADNTNEHNDLEYKSLLRWKDLAGKKFVVGEFGICEPEKFVDPYQCPGQDHFTDTKKRYDRLVGWMKKLKDNGVTQVRIWQLGKDERGHIDCCSFEYLPGIQGHDQPILDWLVRDKWLKGS